MLHDSLLHQSASATDVDFVALTRNPVDHTILFSWVNGILPLY